MNIKKIEEVRETKKAESKDSNSLKLKTRIKAGGTVVAQCG
jgi:hypothetical protein